MKIGEFLIELLVDSGSGSVTLGDLVSKFGELEIASLREIAVLTTFAAKMGRIADQAMATAVAFSNFENQTDLSSQELQRWQIVAEQANVSADAVSNSVVGLQRAIASFRLGKGDIAAFSMLGIRDPRDAFTVLETLRKRIQSLRSPTAVNLMQQIGIDPRMINVLRLSNEEFRKFSSTARGLSPEQVDRYLQLRLELNQLHLVLTNIGYQASERFMPVFEAVIDMVRDGAGYVNEFKEAFAALAIILAGIGFYISPLATGIILLIAAFQDIEFYLKGMPSLIGDIFNKVNAFAAMIDERFSNILPKLEKGLMLAATLPVMGIVAPSAQMAALKSITQNNSSTFNISSTAPAHDVAREAIREQAKQINGTSALLNN